MKKHRILVALLLTATLLFPTAPEAKTKAKKDTTPQPEIASQWNGKKVAYLGDSITDANQLQSQGVFWDFLRNILGIEPLVYGINGHQMNQIIGQAQKLEADHGQEFDAIIVFIGTNDFNASVPVGEWFTEKGEETTIGGPTQVVRKHRRLITDGSTFCGRTNEALAYLKHHFPTKQIILLTPLHRGYATFGQGNIQPDETWANGVGQYIDDYVQAIREAGSIWAMPVIDLNAICGLYPLEPGQSLYFRHAETDLLHPNTEGHRRMAYALAYQLMGYPASF
jgi:lysophospholipase L1-like esterase